MCKTADISLLASTQVKLMNSMNLLINGAEMCGLVDAYSAIRRKLTGSQIAILMYHRVSPPAKDLYLQSLAPEIFDKQIEYLKKEFKILSLEEFARTCRSSDPLPEKTAVITFDDGYKDNYTYAYPILQKYDVPATIFLTTGYIETGKLLWWDLVGYICRHSQVNTLRLDDDGLTEFKIKTDSDRTKTKFRITEKLRRKSESQKWSIIQQLVNQSELPSLITPGKNLILSWSEIQEMAKGKITFGAHTVNHPILTSESLELAKREITQSKRAIEERLKTEITTFSYPDGCYNNEIIDIVRKSGFICATAVSPFRLVTKKDDLYCLNRILPAQDFAEFKAMTAGLVGDISMRLGTKRNY
jgi:peptidoglycan/xylan/chitin deacetylase (PgdA/CDA1 family)